MGGIPSKDCRTKDDVSVISFGILGSLGLVSYDGGQYFCDDWTRLVSLDDETIEFAATISHESLSLALTLRKSALVDFYYGCGSP